LSISVVLSRHRRQIERLIEDSAILAAELRELREKSVPNPSGDAIARMSGPPRGSAVEPRGPGGQRRPH
jgi:hypothetical protein